ncbi:caspase domain-containing protein [Suillus lakei]|nr:caspase domain-containing protein [Suillus lakei]
MPGCPAFLFFPHFKSYTQVNTMMWDLRGNDAAQDRRRSPNPRFPMPSELHRSHDPLPRPFVPLGLPNVPRSASPNMHSHGNLPSLIHEDFPTRGRAPPPPIPHATRPPPSPYMSLPPLRPPPMPVPQFVSNPSNVQPSSRNNHTYAHAHSHPSSISQTRESPTSHSTSAIPQTIRRTTSQQLRFAPPPTQPSSHSLQRASSSQNLHRSRSSQHLRPPTPHSGPSGNGQRPRVNSASSAHRPIFPQQHVQPHFHQQVVPHNGHVHFQYSKCSGRKKALCIGINYKGQRRELRGCINDVHNVKRFLTSNWGYKNGDIVMRNILDAMRWLVKDAHPHDALFSTYLALSSRLGPRGQVPDKDGDEVDDLMKVRNIPFYLEHLIYPVDYKKAGIILDDDMHRIMVKSLPAGCRLTVSLDFSFLFGTNEIPFVQAIFDYHSNGRLKGSHVAPRAQEQKATNADVISFAGCRDDQTSADTTQGGVWLLGAMSYVAGSSASRCVRLTSRTARKPVQSYQELLKSVRDILKQNYQQKPQLSSSHPIDTSLRFIL